MSAKIRAIIADVDGVMVGDKAGVNFPLPSATVIDALRRVNQNGIPVVLCTAKFRVAIDQIIVAARLNNPHIADSGALIIDPLGSKKIVAEHAIDPAIVVEYLSHDQAYTELYSASAYYVRRDSDEVLRNKRSQLLQLEPVLVDSLTETARTETIIKMISYANDVNDMSRIEAQVTPLGDRLNFIWSTHPFMMPRQLCVMTAPRVSKKQASLEVAQYLGVAFDAILGIGDSPADWNFMGLCKYVATVGDSAQLRERCLSKGQENYFAGGSVDDDGFLEILNHFNLT